MKTTLFFSALWLSIASFFNPVDPTILKGTVRDSSGEPLIGASVKVLKDKVFIRGIITDMEGLYSVSMEPGTYNIEISYTGFETVRFADVTLIPNKTHILDAVMTNSVLSEVVITTYKAPLIEQDKTSGGQTLSAEQIRNLPTRSINAIKATPAGKEVRSKSKKAGEGAMPAAPTEPVLYTPVAGEPKPVSPAPPTSIDGGAIDLKGSRSDDTHYYIDGIRVSSGSLPPVKDVEYATESFRETTKEEADEAPTGIITQPAPRAGLLTAGEWNDLHNWNHHWVDLLADGEITTYENMYGFYAHQRYTVMLTNERDIPLADVVIQMKNDGSIVWEAHTDNTGKAELWAGLYDKTSFPNLTVEAWINGKKHDLGTPKPAKGGFNFYKINTECYAPNNVDIVWAVDATGSMGDEIEYLKTEVLDVIGRAKNNNPTLAFRMGTVFYRDKGDDYIVKSSGLSPDINSTVDFIQKQFAAGGGDYPEAVHSALEEVVYGQKWSENAVARICFLVLDASPHQEPEVIASLQKTIREAARLGIRIVPLTASGIQKDTEFLMKFFGLATNGSYVFLTDHSGIGGKHLEPTTDEYKVEPLNDLLVRIITEYTSTQTCEGKSNIRFENDPQQQAGQTLQASYYPNPAVDQFTLELPVEVQSVTLYDSEGNSVRKLEKPQTGPNVIPISDLAPGFYTIRILNNRRMQSGKLMIVR